MRRCQHYMALCVGIVALLQLSSPAFAALAYDTSASSTWGSGTTRSVSITPSVNPGRVLLACVATSSLSGTAEPYTVTAGGSTKYMRKIGSYQHVSYNMALWAYVNPEPVSTTVQANFQSAQYASIAAISFTGADSASPLSIDGTGGGNTSPVTATSALGPSGSIIVDCAQVNGSANIVASVGAGQTSRANRNDGSGAIMMVSTQDVSSGGVMSWSVTGTSITGWATATAVVNPAAGILAQDRGVLSPIGMGVDLIGTPATTNNGTFLEDAEWGDTVALLHEPQPLFAKTLVAPTLDYPLTGTGISTATDLVDPLESAALDTKVPSQLAVKTYVDAKMFTTFVGGGSEANISADSGIPAFGNDSESTVGNANRFPMPYAVDCQYLKVHLSTACPAGSTWNFTVYKNGSATSLSTGGTNSADPEDITHTVVFAAGDTVYLLADETGTCSSTQMGWSMICTGAAP